MENRYGKSYKMRESLCQFLIERYLYNVFMSYVSHCGRVSSGGTLTLVNGFPWRDYSLGGIDGGELHRQYRLLCTARNENEVGDVAEKINCVDTGCIMSLPYPEEKGEPKRDTNVIEIEWE